MKRIFLLNNRMILMILTKTKRKLFYYLIWFFRFSIRNKLVKKTEFKNGFAANGDF